MNTKIIKFDLNKNLYDTLIAKQGDTKSRFLLFNLLDGSIPFSLENRSVRVYAIKADGTEIFNDLIVTDAAKGYCILELTTQILSVAGTVKLELMVIEGDKKLTSNIFYMDVKESINSEKAVVSTNEFGTLLTALASLNEYDNYKNEIKNARGGQVNLKTRLDNFDEHLDTNVQYAENLCNNLFIKNPKTDGVFHIMGGIDSLTAGSAYGKYSEKLCENLKGQIGNGGYGYVKLLRNSTCSGVNFIRDLTDIENTIAKYSLDRYGFYKDNCDGSEYYKTVINTEAWQYCKVIYLKQPNGGKFRVGYNTSSLEVNTLSDSYDLGVLELGTRTSERVTFDTMSGNICVLGLFCYNPTGFIFSEVATAGDRLTDISKLDETFRRKWLDILKPDVYIFNGSTNDNYSDYEVYRKQLEAYLKPFIEYDSMNILVRPQPMGQGRQEAWNIKEKYLINYAKINKCTFISHNELFGGSFENAVSQGLMRGDDPLHPIHLGWNKIAVSYLNLLGFEKVMLNRYTFMLAKKDNKQKIPHKYRKLSPNTSSDFLSIIVVQPNTNAVIELEICAGIEYYNENALKKCYLKYKNHSSGKGIGTLIIEDKIPNTLKLNITPRLENDKVIFNIENTDSSNAIDVSINGNVYTTVERPMPLFFNE